MNRGNLLSWLVSCVGSILAPYKLVCLGGNGNVGEMKIPKPLYKIICSDMVGDFTWTVNLHFLLSEFQDVFCNQDFWKNLT